MTQKERLVELLIANETRDTPEGAENESQEQYDFLKPWAEKCADHLLDNGVIVPPCKVGKVVYSIGKLDGKVHREKVQYFDYDSEDQRFWFGTDGPGVFTSEHIGKWVFFIRKEAEQALKERCDQ